MSKRAILIDAKGLIQDPEHWTQGTSARDQYGYETSNLNVNACRFCAMGAAGLATFRHNADYREQRAVVELLNEIAIDLGYKDEVFGLAAAAYLNDNTDHDSVMVLFDLAIERADD